MRFEAFNWDKGNSNKCEKHGLRQRDIEQFFLQDEIYVAPDLKHSSLEERFLAIGKGLNNKYIIVVFTFRVIKQKKLLRPISARFMNKKEVKKYEEEFKKYENR